MLTGPGRFQHICLRMLWCLLFDRMNKTQSADLHQQMQKRFNDFMSVIVKKILRRVLRRKNRKTSHCFIALAIFMYEITNSSDLICAHFLLFECPREEMARHYQIASVLYDVLKTVTPEKFHSEVLQSASINYRYLQDTNNLSSLCKSWNVITWNLEQLLAVW